MNLYENDGLGWGEAILQATSTNKNDNNDDDDDGFDDDYDDDDVDGNGDKVWWWWCGDDSDSIGAQITMIEPGPLSLKPFYNQ